MSARLVVSAVAVVTSTLPASLALTLAGKPAPPTTTAPAVAPSTAPSAGPTTTGLPTISLAAPTTTVAPPTMPTPPPTTAAPVPGTLFASLDDLAARWNEALAKVPVSGADVGIRADEIVRVVVGEPRDVFAGWIDPTSYLGGIVDARTGHGLMLAVVVAPTLPTAPDVLTTAATMIDPEALPDILRAVGATLGADPGTHSYVPAGDVDFVVSVLEPRAAGGHLMALTAAPVTDEATAVAHAEGLNETLPHTLQFVE